MRGLQTYVRDNCREIMRLKIGRKDGIFRGEKDIGSGIMMNLKRLKELNYGIKLLGRDCRMGVWTRGYELLLMV